MLRDLLTGREYADPGALPGRRRRRQVQGHGRRRPEGRGPARPRRDGLRAVPRRPDALRGAPAEHPLLDRDVERRVRRDRHGPAARHRAMEPVDRRLGLRHGRRASPTSRPKRSSARVRLLVGDPDLEIEINSTSVWHVNQAHAPIYSKGRVFCGGDAVHRHPPSSGLGSNTCMQDAFNLAWKLAFVVKGHAGEGLLDSYTLERAPVGAQIVEARQPVAAGLRAAEPELPRHRCAGSRGGRPREAGRSRARGRRPAHCARRGAEAEELRVQRPGRRAQPALRVGRRDPGSRRCRRGLEARPAAAPAGDDPARVPSCRMPGWWARTAAACRRSTWSARASSRWSPASPAGAWAEAAQGAGPAVPAERSSSASRVRRTPTAPGTRVREIEEAGALAGAARWRRRMASAPAAWPTRPQAQRELEQALTALLDRPVRVSEAA